MKVRTLFTLTALWLSMPVVCLSQTKVSAAEQAKIIEAIDQTAKSMRTLQCNFRQVKTLSLLSEEIVSQGTMHYRQPDRLRWQYKLPYSYIFIVNGSRVMMENSDGKSVVDARQSKMFKEITQIMINSVTGKCLSDGKSFKVSIYSEGGEWVAHLVPTNKEMKSMFSLVKLHVNPQRRMVTRVDLVEKTGDITNIYLTDVRTNGAIDDKVFSVD